MRRISPVTKEAFCWTRSQVVYSYERLEHWENTAGPETYKELVELNEALLDGFKSSLTKLVAIEFQEVAHEFGLDEEHAQQRGSAFPHLQGTDIDLNESVVEYCAEIIEDLMEVFTIPAISIADEFEEWLSELYDWHARENN